MGSQMNKLNEMILLCADKIVDDKFRIVSLPYSAPILMHLQKTTFENTVTKEEIAHYEQFLL